MRTKVVSSAEIFTKPWGGPCTISRRSPPPDGWRLVAAFELISKMHQAHPDEADLKNWSDTPDAFPSPPLEWVATPWVGWSGCQAVDVQH